MRLVVAMVYPSTVTLGATFLAASGDEKNTDGCALRLCTEILMLCKDEWDHTGISPQFTLNFLTDAADCILSHTIVCGKKLYTSLPAFLYFSDNLLYMLYFG